MKGRDQNKRRGEKIQQIQENKTMQEKKEKAT